MKILLIAAFLLLIVGVLNRDINPTVKSSIEDKEAEEQQDQPDNTILDSNNDNQPKSPSPEPTVTNQKEEETPFSKSTTQSISISDFIYPNSTISQRSENTLELTSNDNTDIITDWYKDRIRSKNMNTKSFVVTKTNNNVLNKLVAADGNLEIRVEIIKNQGIDTTNIKVIIVE